MLEPFCRATLITATVRYNCYNDGTITTISGSTAANYRIKLTAITGPVQDAHHRNGINLLPVKINFLNRTVAFNSVLQN